MTAIKISAPGKIHLLGEHTVVYGKPALLSTINKRSSVVVTPRKDDIIRIVAKNYQQSFTTTPKEILDITTHAQQAWLKYKETNSINYLQDIVSNPLLYPSIVIGEALQYFCKTSIPGMEITIDSEIPIGSGMGSSAALAVSLAAIFCTYFSSDIDKSTVNEIALRAEQKKHGNPSGGDNTSSSYGGFLWFTKHPEISIKPIDVQISKKMYKNLFLVQTGEPHESTAEMVHAVNELYNKDKKACEEIFHKQGQLVIDVLDALEQKEEKKFIDVIKQGEKNLERLGVVSKSVQLFIRVIEHFGGAAKICGGGGKTKGTGAVLVYMKKKNILKNLIEQYNFDYAPVTLGQEGVRVD